MNKVSGGDGIPAKLFQILKNNVKVLQLNMTANLENSAMFTGQEKVSFFSSLKKGIAKNVQTTTQLHAFHMVAN